MNIYEDRGTCLLCSREVVCAVYARWREGGAVWVVRFCEECHPMLLKAMKQTEEAGDE
jgi:hypothetical protein